MKRTKAFPQIKYQGTQCGVCGGNAHSDIPGKLKSQKERLRKKAVRYVRKII